MRALLFGLLIAGLSVALMACPTDACDGDEVSFGKGAGEGHLVTPNLWESNPVEGTWLALTPQRVWRFFPTGLSGRTLRPPTVFISAESDPALAHNNFTLASGNLAEVSVSGDQFSVHNNTCGTFLMRVEVEAYPTSADADTNADALPEAAADAAVNPDAK